MQEAQAFVLNIMEAEPERSALFTSAVRPVLNLTFDITETPLPPLKNPSFDEFKARFLKPERMQEAIRMMRTVRKIPSYFCDLSVFNTFQKCKPQGQLGEVIEFAGPRGKATFRVYDKKSDVFEGSVKDPPEMQYANDNDCDTDSEVIRMGTNNVLVMVKEGYDRFARSVSNSQEPWERGTPTVKFNRAKSTMFREQKQGGAGNRQRSQMPVQFQDPQTNKFELRMRGLWR